MKKMETILFRERNGIGEITLNRPEVLNAMTSGMLIELMAILSEIKMDPGIRAVILTGAGTKSFSTGMDLHELEGSDPLEGKRYSEQGQQIYAAVI